MPAQSRRYSIAAILESFLDSHEDDLPPLMFRELDDLAGDIDKEAGELQENLDSMTQENEDLRAQIEELEG